MKNKLVIVAALAVSIGSASAFTVSTANVATFTATGGLPITSEGGTLIPSGTGIIATGYFSSLADNAVDATNIAGDFQILGATSAFAAGAFGNPPGIFDLTTLGGLIGDGSDFIGENVYIVIGNGATLGASTEFAVWNSGTTFSKSADVPGTSVAITPGGVGKTGLIYGTVGGPQNPGVNFDESIALSSAPIPEPSITLLGALGILGLIRRRR